MFFLTRRRERARAGLPVAIPCSLARRRRLALAGDAHPLRPLAAASVRLRPLAAHREAAAMADAAIGADLREPLHVLRALAAQLALDSPRLDRLAKLHDLVVGEVLDVGVGADPGLAEDAARRRGADPVHVGEADLGA